MKTPIVPQSPEARPAARLDNPKPYIMAGLVIVVQLFGGLIGWSVTATISGAVIAPGTLTVESSRKSVQHLEGGVVSEILVREGDAVRAGQLLIRLDDTIERTNLALIVDQLHELSGRQARLRAEFDSRDSIRFDPALLAQAEDAKVREILDGQRSLFAARRAAREANSKILGQRIVGFQEQIKGLKAQNAARARQIALIQQELTGAEKLHKKGHAPITRLLELRRQMTRIEALQAEHRTDIARARNSIGEVELQMAQREQDLREALSEELRDIHALALNLTERRVAAEARLARVDIKSPQSGRVLALAAHTVGGVIQPGEAIMEIVPGGDALVLQAQVMPQDVDKLQAGQKSRIVFSAFERQTTPEILGTIEGISADRVDDPRRPESFFVARIRIEDAELAKLGNLELVPGMPAEVFIQTGERLALSYLMKPLLDSFKRAFKDG